MHLPLSSERLNFYLFFFVIHLFNVHDRKTNWFVQRYVIVEHFQNSKKHTHTARNTLFYEFHIEIPIASRAWHTRSLNILSSAKFPFITINFNQIISIRFLQMEHQKFKFWNDYFSNDQPYRVVHSGGYESQILHFNDYLLCKFNMNSCSWIVVNIITYVKHFLLLCTLFVSQFHLRTNNRYNNKHNERWFFNVFWNKEISALI